MEDTIYQISKVCHAVNKQYCHSIGDNTQVDWEDAPEWQKESIKKGVILHYTKETRAEDSHESWWSLKKKEGWVYGEVKDPSKKTHPCCVPFKELPTKDQAKDYIFKAIVDNLKPILPPAQEILGEDKDI